MPTPPRLEAWETLREVDPSAAAAVINQLRKSVFKPHAGGQLDVMRSAARFRILRAGRRWGKTQLAAHEVIRAALSGPDQMVWWVANSDKNVRRGYRAVQKQLPKLLLAKDPPSDTANDRYITFKNGSTIEFYTAGSPDSLAGEGVDFVVVDEAALIAENVWLQLIRPTLSDTDGRALLISTPRGRNWFHKQWYRGQDPSKPNYESWHFPTASSPFIPDEEIEDARDSLPAILFASEYLAEFTSNAASIFNLEREGSVVPGLALPQGWVTLGIDLGKKEDFTVIRGVNTGSPQRVPCLLERYNETSWAVQQTYIEDAVAALEADPAVEGVTVAVDSTGVGEVVFDNLEDAGMDVVPVNFSSGPGGRQKERMARLLAADIEHGRAVISEDERDEFEHYEFEVTESGRMKFAAPEGEHDDKVSAAMIANWAAVHEAPPGIQSYDPHGDDEQDDLDDYDIEEDDGAAEEVAPDSPASILARTMPRG